MGQQQKIHKQWMLWSADGKSILAQKEVSYSADGMPPEIVPWGHRNFRLVEGKYLLQPVEAD